MSKEMFIDFDGTISPNHYPHPLIEPPFKGVKETLAALQANGHKIVIFSCRANKDLFGYTKSERSTNEMIDYLQKWSIPYDEVYYGKPLYEYLVDDRAGFDGNWLALAATFKSKGLI